MSFFLEVYYNKKKGISYNENEFVTSELISSYAWDTALNFICQTNKDGYKLATTTDSTYGNINTGNRTQTGAYTVEVEGEGERKEVVSDKYSNIFDLLGNCHEWTTEYSGFNYRHPSMCLQRWWLLLYLQLCSYS